MKYRQKEIDINKEEPKIGQKVNLLLRDGFWKVLVYEGNKNDFIKWIKFIPLYSQEQQYIYNKKCQFFLDTWIKNKINWLINEYDGKWIRFNYDHVLYDELYCSDFELVKPKLDYLGFNIEKSAFCGDLFYKFTDKIEKLD